MVNDSAHSQQLDCVGSHLAVLAKSHMHHVYRDGDTRAVKMVHMWGEAPEAWLHWPCTQKREIFTTMLRKRISWREWQMYNNVTDKLYTVELGHFLLQVLLLFSLWRVNGKYQWCKRMLFVRCFSNPDQYYSHLFWQWGPDTVTGPGRSATHKVRGSSGKQYTKKIKTLMLFLSQVGVRR